MLCRRLKCSWSELQNMPEDTVAVWEAVIAGEELARRAKAAASQGGPSG